MSFFKWLVMKTLLTKWGQMNLVWWKNTRIFPLWLAVLRKMRRWGIEKKKDFDGYVYFLVDGYDQVENLTCQRGGWFSFLYLTLWQSKVNVWNNSDKESSDKNPFSSIYYKFDGFFEFVVCDFDEEFRCLPLFWKRKRRERRRERDWTMINDWFWLVCMHLYIYIYICYAWRARLIIYIDRSMLSPRTRSPFQKTSLK